jgi:hypothetical protein
MLDYITISDQSRLGWEEVILTWWGVQENINQQVKAIFYEQTKAIHVNKQIKAIHLQADQGNSS